MNKKTLMLAALTTAITSTAHAQSSVTLYGTIDAGVAYVNKVAGKSLWAQDSGALSDTYFGLRGSEDLGGGTHAIFTLESGFNLGNGQFGRFDANLGAPGSGIFNRQAFVGLQNDRFGTLTFGRQYDSVVDYLKPLSLAGQAGGVNLAGHPFDADNLANSFSSLNTVKYQSANYGGFQGGATYGFSNAPGAFVSGGRLWSVGASYERGPFKAGAAYLQRDNTALGANAGNTGTVSAITAARQRVLGVGANYAYGPGTVGVLWTHVQLQNATLGAGLQNAVGSRFDNIEVNGTYGLTPAFAAVASYTYTFGRLNYASGQATTPKWHSAALGFDYALSKRTDVYLASVYQHASDKLGLSTSGLAQANETSIAGMIPASSTENQVGVAAGIRHRF